MKFRKNREDEAPEINMIPFIDILLTILIFLTLTTTYSKFTELKVSLPAADTEQLQDQMNEITVAVNAQGEYAVNNRRISYYDPETLANDLKEAARQKNGSPVLVIAADGDAPHQRVVNILEAANIAGLERITFAAQSRK